MAQLYILMLLIIITPILIWLIFNSLTTDGFKQPPRDTNNVDDIYLLSIHPKTHIKVQSSIENIRKSFNREVNIILVEGVIVDPETLATMDITLSRGQVGCAMAHANIWDTIINKGGNGWSFIFEDDVIFLDNKLYVDELITQFPDDAEAVNLGGCETKHSKFNCPPDQNWCKGWAACTHAYCLTLTGAKLAKQNYIDNNFLVAVDTSLRRGKKFKKNSYILTLPTRPDEDSARKLVACKSGYFCQRRDGEFKSDISSL